MSATAEKTSTAAQDRKRIRETEGPTLRKEAKAIGSALVRFGNRVRHVAENGFTVGEVKAGKLDAYMLTWTGLRPSTWKGYARAAEIVAELPAAKRDEVSSWPLDGIKDLGPLDEADRLKLIKAVGPNPDTKTIRSKREKLKPMSARNVKTDAEKTTALAARISETVSDAIGTDATRYTAMIAGAQLAQDNPGQNVAAAILFLSTQSAAAEKAVK